ncbi:MAG: phage minor capsid protein, partial [Acidobacteriota bacterium]
DLAKANRTILRIAKKYVSLVDQGRRAAAKLQALTGEEGETIGKWAAEAVAEGQTGRELQIRIMEYLRGQFSDGKFIVISGRNYKLSKYSELVASYRLREAATEATINAALEYDHDLVEIPAKGGSCEDCIDIEGKVYSLSGNDPKYPKLTDEERPPIHPRCRHYLRVVSESSLKFREAS